MFNIFDYAKTIKNVLIGIVACLVILVVYVSVTSTMGLFMDVFNIETKDEKIVRLTNDSETLKKAIVESNENAEKAEEREDVVEDIAVKIDNANADIDNDVDSVINDLTIHIPADVSNTANITIKAKQAVHIVKLHPTRKIPLKETIKHDDDVIVVDKVTYVETGAKHINAIYTIYDKLNIKE